MQKYPLNEVPVDLEPCGSSMGAWPRLSGWKELPPAWPAVLLQASQGLLTILPELTTAGRGGLAAGACDT